MAQKSKSKLYKHHGSQHINKLSTITSQNGFVCSFNTQNRKQCMHECYTLLSYYSGCNDVDQNTCTSEDDISKELATLKSMEKQHKEIQINVKNIAIVSTTIEDPNHVLQKLLEDMYTNGKPRVHYIHRITPFEAVCKAYTPNIISAFKPLCDKYFMQKNVSFAILFKHRYNNSLKKEDVINAVADCVTKTGLDHKVDLKNAELTIILEIIKGYALIGIAPQYFKFKKYNLFELSRLNESSKQ